MVAEVHLHPVAREAAIKFLVRLMLWASLAFVACWFLHAPWQHAIGAMSAQLAAPPGTEIEMMGLELFFPFDLGVFWALCLASAWTPMARRVGAAAIGTPILIAAEVLALVTSIKFTLGTAEPAVAERMTDSLIRTSGLVASSALWLCLLGREQLSLASRRWPITDGVGRQGRIRNPRGQFPGS